MLTLNCRHAVCKSHRDTTVLADQLLLQHRHLSTKTAEETAGLLLQCLHAGHALPAQKPCGSAFAAGEVETQMGQGNVLRCDAQRGVRFRKHACLGTSDLCGDRNLCLKAVGMSWPS